MSTTETPIFDLEQEFLQCWAIIDDLKLITEYFINDPKWKGMDASLADALMNKYFGLAEVYDVKMQKAWDSFEAVCREHRSLKHPNLLKNQQDNVSC